MGHAGKMTTFNRADRRTYALTSVSASEPYCPHTNSSIEWDYNTDPWINDPSMLAPAGSRGCNRNLLCVTLVSE